jgi:hypothetical protein
MFKILSAGIFCALLVGSVAAQRQSRDVIEAYRVCRQFQTLLAEDLDFDRAFEATFTKDAARRREIAIYEGDFGDLRLKKIDDTTLLKAYKARMQIVYLMLPLASPDSNEEEARFFPPPIKAIFDRKPPETSDEFPAYAQQLHQDATALRAHLNQLAAQSTRVAQRVRQFKQDLLQMPKLPDSEMTALTGYSRGHVLEPDEKYYQIGEYSVIREGREMKIIGIQFFTRLF